MMLTSDFV